MRTHVKERESEKEVTIIEGNEESKTEKGADLYSTRRKGPTKTRARLWVSLSKRRQCLGAENHLFTDNGISDSCSFLSFAFLICQKKLTHDGAGRVNPVTKFYHHDLVKKV